MTSRVLEHRTNRFPWKALIASALVLACSGPSENDFFGDDPPGASGGGGNMAGTSGTGNAGSATGGSSGKGGSAGTGGSMSGAGGSAGSEATGGTAGAETGGTAGAETGGTAGTETGGTAGTETGGTAGSGGVAGSAAGTTGTEAGAAGMNEAGAGGAPPTCVPEDERCDGIDNDCENGADEGNVCPEGCVGAHFEGHDYLFCREESSGPLGGDGRAWGQARMFCVAEDKVLVHLETETEANFVYDKLAELDLGVDAWMGATDRSEDEWCWEGTTQADAVQFYDDDTEMAVDGYFIDWREGEPNDGGGEDCGVIEDQGDGTFLWDDRSCTLEMELFVCEGEP